MIYMLCYALCRATTVLLTTRMPKPWLCVGISGFGIGVVSRVTRFSLCPLTKKVPIFGSVLLFCQPNKEFSFSKILFAHQ
jgi:hypothetical protein